MYHAGISDVQVEPVPGELTDHYDPTSKRLRLSENVYGGRSLASLGIAAHEAGHAIQHASAYPALALRTTIVPLCNFGTMLGPIMVILGLLIFRSRILVDIGIAAYSFAVMFTLITLPVELNASSRAMVMLTEHGMITTDEAAETRRVLNAAAWTYVAAAAVAISQLIRLFILRDMCDD